MMLAIEALEAWWPPTLTPLGFGRTRFAWCTIAIASQSTRRSTRSRTSRSTVASEGLSFSAIDMRPSLLARVSGIRSLRHHGVGHVPLPATAPLAEPPRRRRRGRHVRAGRRDGAGGVPVLPAPHHAAAARDRALARPGRAGPWAARGGPCLAAGTGAGRAPPLLAADLGPGARRQPGRRRDLGRRARRGA